jgi:CMP-N-acetylneuraminic acid synthetase
MWFTKIQLRCKENSNIKERYLFVYYKVLSAQNAGAIAVIVVNTESESIAMSGADSGIRIPAISVTNTIGESLINQLKQKL